MLDYAITNDIIRNLRVNQTPGWIHEDHRYALYLLWYAQENNIIARPSKLVLFDYHHDYKDLTEQRLNLINSSISQLNEETMFNLCKDNLSQLDDDWIKAGFELGIISDVVIFGVHEPYGFDDLNEYQDQRGGMHICYMSGSSPGECMEYQGALSDIARSNQLSSLWKILEWVRLDGSAFNLGNFNNDLWVSIDLDCFVMSWEDFLFPWPEEVFNKKYLKVSDYFTTAGWSGNKFMDTLVNKSSLVTIAREPQFCGGDDKCDTIFNNLNQIIFNGNISI